MFSPFPGMDPFLEDQAEWSSMHTRLITSISDHLADIVSPDFFVKIEQRVYIISPDSLERQPIVPDVYLVTGRGAGQPTAMAGAITAYQ